MNTEILGVALQILLLLVISYPLGKHIAKVYKDGNDCMRFMAPIERFIYKLAGINPNEEMDWKVFLKSLLIINVFWFFWGMILLVSQGYLPLNPDGNSGQSPDLAFNTCISFMVNCNLQHYSGESGLTYFTQLFVIHNLRPGGQLARQVPRFGADVADVRNVPPAAFLHLVEVETSHSAEADKANFYRIHRVVNKVG